jgi:hypothetical protein
MVGATSVEWDTGAPFLASAVFPETRNARWDLSRADRLVVNLKPQNSNSPKFQGNWPVFVLGKDSGESIVLRPTRNILDTHLDKWRRYEVRFAGGGDFVREDHGVMDLSQVDWFAVQADTWGSGFRIFIDGLSFLPEGPRRADLRPRVAPTWTSCTSSGGPSIAAMPSNTTTGCHSSIPAQKARSAGPTPESRSPSMQSWRMQDRWRRWGACSRSGWMAWR